MAGRATEVEIAAAQDMYKAGLQAVAVTGLVQNRYLDPGSVKQSLALGAGEKRRRATFWGTGAATALVFGLGWGSGGLARGRASGRQP